MAATLLPLIPLPRLADRLEGEFVLKAIPSVGFQSNDGKPPIAAELFADWMERAAGSRPALATGSDADVAFVLSGDGEGDGYTLDIAENQIRLAAATEQGLRYAFQTLRQLFPAEAEAPGGFRFPAALPRLHIEDAPRFAWRGLSFDCCRHFPPVPYLLRLLDLLALHKMNKFHWHLTEDQAWRLQIDRYPKLTEVGAFRGAQNYGGFYTKDDVRRVLAHAERLGIEVIPEIEMPGHSTAALAAYPELSCTGGPFEVSEKWGIHEDIYCGGKDATFEFMEGVLEEVMELFPSEYIHIGGDEAPKVRWEKCPACQKRMREEGLADEKQLQTYFIHRIGTWLYSRGKKIIGWDEIAEGGVPQGAILQHWRYEEHLEEALRTGHQVICSNLSYCYMDFPHFKYSPSITDPPMKRFWMQAISNEKAWHYEFIPEDATPGQEALFLGGEATMWLEYTPTMDQVDAQLWPRLAGLAEAFWSPKERGTVHDYSRRLVMCLPRLRAMGVRYFPWVLMEK